MRFLALVLVVLVGAGCAPAITAGKVVEKEFKPAHDTTWYMPVRVGETCSGFDEYRICTPIYTYIPMTTHHPDAWYLTFEGTNSDSEEVHQRTVQISESVYSAIEKGDWYEIPEEENDT